MAPSLFRTALVALSVVSRALAFDDISIPSTVAAGQDVRVTIENDLLLGSDSVDAEYSTYRVYLSANPTEESSYYPICWLVNSSAIDVADITVQIPASVGPNANNYSLVVTAFNGIDDPTSGFQYSNDFALTGATGVWGAFELDPSWPYQVAFEDAVPCTSYDCARSCYQSYYPDNITEVSQYEDTYRCIAACPGVTYPSWETLLAQLTDESDNGSYEEDYGYDDSYDSDDSTFTVTETVTASSTSSAASQTASTSTTSTASSATSTSSPQSSASSSSTASASVPLVTASGAMVEAAISRYALLGALLASIIAVANL